jgi:chemotaxis protein CheZ
VADANDSPELEALFDSIASQRDGAINAAPTDKPQSSVMAAVLESSSEAGDSEELQSLFDSLVAQQGQQTQAQTGPGGSGEEWSGQEKAFNTIGHLVRQLHDALLGLGYDKLIEKTVSAIPDAKDRLAYIANLTEQAACRVLNATDIAMPVQEQLGADAAGLAKRWDSLYANQLSVAEFRALADETRAFLKAGVPDKVAQTNAQLMEIMMAQDFQDLTGQVIKKIVGLTQEMESSMMSVLIDIMPEMRRTKEVNSLLNGPVINSGGRGDVVVGQEQVDDLLDSLGF